MLGIFKKEEQALIFLYKSVDNCPLCRKTQNKLRHIWGVGKIKPRFLLLLINPTYRNISSNQDYKGPRFPFIGVRSFWRILGDAGLINPKLSESLPPASRWKIKHTLSLKQEILKNNLFITNIVKCTFGHSSYPTQDYFEYYKEILKNELEIVKPRYIITFGQLSFKFLTGKNLTFSSFFTHENYYKIHFKENLSSFKIPVLPCYFPVGRGKPKDSISILKIYNSLFL